MTSFLMNDEIEEFDLRITCEDDLYEIIHSDYDKYLIYYGGNFALEGIIFGYSNEDLLEILLSNACPKSLYFYNCSFYLDFGFLNSIDEKIEKISVIECALDSDNAINLITHLPSKDKISVDLSGNKIGLNEKVFFDFLKYYIYDFNIETLILKDNNFTEKGISEFKDFLKLKNNENMVTF